MTGDNRACVNCGAALFVNGIFWTHVDRVDCLSPVPAELPAEDGVLEGRVLDPGEVGYVPPAGMAQSADHWPAFTPVQVVFPPGLSGWHDEAVRLEQRGRLDRGGCECDDCLADRYSGEDYY